MRLWTYQHPSILDGFIDGAEPEPRDAADCFAVQLYPRKGRPPLFFQPVQACIPFIEPAWLLGWETLDTQKLLEVALADLIVDGPKKERGLTI